MNACKRTYVTFCVYSTTSALNDSISRCIGLEPTRVSHKGNLYGWYLSTQDKITSVDVTDHLESLLNTLETKKAKILQLSTEGYDMRVFCFWESFVGNGGPVLTSKIMSKLSELSLELHFDIWFQK